MFQPQLPSFNAVSAVERFIETPAGYYTIDGAMPIHKAIEIAKNRRAEGFDVALRWVSGGNAKVIARSSAA